MYNHAPENYICPLCQIAGGEPTTGGSQEESVIYRDEFITAFVAGKWWRSNKGHVIIIPNTHVENLYDLPEELGHRIFDLSKKIAITLKKAYECEGVSTKQHNEHAGSQEVWHYHLHIIPRYENDNHYLNDNDTYWATPEEKQSYVDKIKDQLNGIS